MSRAFFTNLMRETNGSPPLPMELAGGTIGAQVVRIARIAAGLEGGTPMAGVVSTTDADGEGGGSDSRWLRLDARAKRNAFSGGSSVVGIAGDSGTDDGHHTEVAP